MDSQQDSTSSTGYTEGSGLQKLDCNYQLLYVDDIHDTSAVNALLHDTGWTTNLTEIAAGGTAYTAEALYDRLENRNAATGDSWQYAGFYRVMPVWFGLNAPRTFAADNAAHEMKDISGRYPLWEWSFRTPGYTGAYLVGSIYDNGIYNLNVYGKSLVSDGLYSYPVYTWEPRVKYTVNGTSMTVAGGDIYYNSGLVNYNFFWPFDFSGLSFESNGGIYDMRLEYDESGGYFYCANHTLYADTAGIYKVFGTVSDLQAYLDNGGSNEPVPVNYTSITYNTTTNNIVYNPPSPDDGDGDGPGSGDNSVTVNVDTSGIENKLDAIIGNQEEQTVRQTNILSRLTDIYTRQGTMLTALQNGLSSVSNGLTTVAATLSSIYATVSGIWTDTDDIAAKLDTVMDKMPSSGNSPDYTSQLDKIYRQLVLGNVLDAVDLVAENLWEIWDHFAGEAAEDISEIADAAVDRFPFCIPGVIVSAITLTNVAASPPVFTVPLRFAALDVDYDLSIDFSTGMWSGCRTVIHYMSLFLAMMGFIKLTIMMVKKGSA